MNRYYNYGLIATGISVLSAKVIPLIVSMYLVLRMNVNTYANWTYLFQYVVLISSGLGAVLNTEYSKRYAPSKYERHALRLFIGHRDIKVLSTIFVLLLIILSEFTSWIMTLSFILILLNTINNYILNALRFRRDYDTLMLASVLKLFCFSSILFYENISLLNLFFTMIISLSVPLCVILFYYRLIPVYYTSSKESWFLLVYGLATSLFISLERFYLRSKGLSDGEYSSIIYAVSLVMLVTPIVEIVKQYLVPDLYRGYKTLSYTLFNDRTVLKFLIVLSFLQILLPLVAYYSLVWLDKIPKFLPSDIGYNILQVSIGMAFYNLYHFMNPLFFLNNHSRFLLLFQVMGTLLFMLILSLGISFYISKMIVLIIVPVFLFFFRIKRFIYFG